MVNALGIAADFFADHAEGIGIVLAPRTRPMVRSSSSSTSSAQAEGNHADTPKLPVLMLGRMFMD